MSSVGKANEQKPHAVCIPFPIQGHITPMLQLAKLLHFNGFHITFVNTVYNQRRLLKSQGPAAMEGLKDFRFHAIPDGLPPTHADVTQDFISLCKSTSKNCLGPFKDLLAQLHKDSLQSPMEVPPVTCIIPDLIMTFAVDAAEEFGIPACLYCGIGDSTMLVAHHLQSFIERDLFPLKDVSQLTNGYLDTKVNFIPGMEGISLKELPNQLHTTNPEDFILKFTVSELKRGTRAIVLVLNTFHALEHDVVDGLSAFYRNVLCVGPQILALNNIPKQSLLHKMDSSLWTDEPECISWLNERGPNSVVYVNYGSITVMTCEQLVEFAWGLANSKCHFLWIIRPDLVIGNKAMLPPEFVKETKGRGFLASWCQQRQVLKHPAIGGFLTHCGWNSIMESLVEGVPNICWPFFSDQQPNCWLACNKWGTGLQLDNDVKRDAVEKQVKELMEGDKGKETKRNTMKWKSLAEEAVAPNGPSTLDLKKLVKLLAPKKA